MSPGSKSKPVTVGEFVSQLEHARRDEIEAVRQIILAADPSISEGIKWNAPSFRTTEWFATFNLRARDAVQVIFHLGAKVKARAARPEIDDTESLLDWLAIDRASIMLRDMKDVAKRRPALRKIVRSWIVHV